jgi:superfamily II DNA or RNA helicase
VSRSSEGSYFVIDPIRAKKNGVKANEAISLLKDLGVEVTGDLEKEIREATLPDYDLEIYWNNGKLAVKSYVFLYEKYPELKEILKYDKESKLFFTTPHNYSKILKILNEKGSEYVDKLSYLREPRGKFTVKGELRDYQKEALEKWKENGYRGVIALPTGAGKTVVGSAAITLVNVPTLIVAFTREQMMQWRDTILRFTDVKPTDIGLFYSEEKKVRLITVATYQTAYRYVDELGDKFGLLVIDEAHHLPADKFRTIAEGLVAPYRMALSATPFREDGLHVELFSLMGGLVYFKSFNELAERGYLANYQVVTVQVRLTPEEELKVRSLLNAYKKLANGRQVKELVELAKKGDENAINALKLLNEARKIINLSKAKVQKVKELVEANKGKKIIVFTQFVEQAEEIAKEVGGFLLTGKLSKSERESALKSFKASQSGVLVVTTVGDEGLDIPDAEVGILVGGTSSRRQFVQRLGRLLRPKEGKNAVMYEIVTKGTPEEYQAKKRKSLDLDGVFLS